MKRPPGLWVLLSAGVLLLLLQNVHGRKATELIFGKTTTTTTTTPATLQDTEDGENKDGSPVTNTEEGENVIKSNLTGVPQVDYIFDPNLPRELNGYNLSSYPFLNSMPKDIDFKCDGLHDGFYASVPHKCQVYHQCLYGTRYDFLCANYTAFDQKTFICHFVSEVDCNNSHKYWHRNDALYQAATTTTTTTTTAKPPPPAVISTSRRPPGAGRRPRPSRRRPQYDYYDDEYEDDVRDDYYEEPPSRRRRKRPRPQRRRPIYEDDYEDYEDDRYDRRGSGKRNGDGDDRKSSDGDGERRRPDDRRNKEDNKRPYDERDKDRKSNDDQRQHDDRRYDDRRKDDRRRDYEDRYRHDKYDDDDDRHDRDRKKESDHKRRPLDDDDDYKNDRNKRPSNDRRYENRRPSNDRDSYDRPRKAHRRPYDDDDDRRSYNNRHRPNDDRDDLLHSQDNKRPSDNQGLVKPNSGSSVFNQPRTPPRIRPPVPRNEQTKFSYKTVTEKQPSKVPEEDFYEYEDDPLPKQSTRRPQHQESSTKRLADDTRENRRPSGLGSKPRTQTSRRPAIVREPAIEDYPEESPRHNPKQEPIIRDVKHNLQNRNNRPLLEDATTTTVKPLTVKERNTSHHPSPKFLPKEPRIKPTTETIIPSTTATTTKEAPRERQEPVIKVVKRPFLPSRGGGNPLSARGLQPVGAKALDQSRNAPLQESPDYTDDAEAPPTPDTFAEQRQNYKLSSSAARESTTVQNARQYPTLTENRANAFLINEQPSSQSYQPDPSYEPQPKEAPETRPFKPSPVLIKVPVRVKYANNEEFRPGSNRPLRPNQHRDYEESRPTERGAVADRNPLDINENEYDVTLNDALNPTIPNLPIRNFPTSFASDTDYTYNSYQRPRYDQAPEGRYQARAPSQRIETVQPYISGDGKKYIDLSQNTNFRSSPQITQAYYTF